MHQPIQSRTLYAAAATALALAGIGCTTPNVIKTESPALAQGPVDEATELRDAPKSVAFYHSGAVQAWPTRWYYAPNPDNTTVENFVADPVMFLVQAASLPVTLGPDYPFRKIYYAGDVVPPSYNAMPPLPPEPTISIASPYPDPLSAPQEPVLPPLPPVPEETPALILPPEPAKPSKSSKPLSTPASTVSPSTRLAH